MKYRDKRVSAGTDLALQCRDLSPVRKVHENPWFHINDRGGYYVLEYPVPQTVILPVVERRAFVMVRVKRPVIGDCPLELPAGGALPGESLAAAAQRELAEETGIHVAALERFRPMLPLSEMPGRMPVLLNGFTIHLSMAEWEDKKDFDDEITQVCLYPFDAVKRLIASGAIYLSSPISIISRYFFQMTG